MLRCFLICVAYSGGVSKVLYYNMVLILYTSPLSSRKRGEVYAVVEEACGDETTFPYLACSFLSWPLVSLVQSQHHHASTSISVSPHPLCTPCSNSGCERTNPMQGQGFVPHCASKWFIWWCKALGSPDAAFWSNKRWHRGLVSVHIYCILRSSL